MNERPPSWLPHAYLVVSSVIVLLLWGPQVCALVNGQVDAPPATPPPAVATIAASEAALVTATVEPEHTPTPEATSTPGPTLTPAEPGWHGPRLTARQLRGLALYVTDDDAFAGFAVSCWTGESGRGGLYYVGAVNRNDDGSLDSGIAQQNDREWPDLDHERIRRDPVVAMAAAYRTYQVLGAGAWFGCPEGVQ